jgi:CO dehydrogenase maturation factor
LERLQQAGVLTSHHLRAMPLDLLAMGQGEGPGCYCSVNHALATVLGQIMAHYDLVLVDNEAGLEHLSRYRLKRVDLFLVVTTPGQAAQSVARRILDTARRAGMELSETGIIVNRVTNWNLLTRLSRNGLAVPNTIGYSAPVPNSHAVTVLDLMGQPVVTLPGGSPVREALAPIVEQLLACA